MTAAATGLVAFIAGAAGGVVGTKLFVVAIGGLLLGSVVLFRPAFVGIIALLAMFNVNRLGAGSSPGAMGGISYSDATLAGATLLALPVMARTNELRRLALPFLGIALYFTALLPTLILNQSHRADMEAVHRFILVGGALVVGAWLTRAGLAGTAMKTLLLVGAVVGIVTILTGAAHGFSRPAEPLGLNKNYGGALQSDMAIITLVLGRSLGLSDRARVGYSIIFVGAAVAAHSRGSILGTCVGLFLVLVLGGFAHSRVTKSIVIALAIGLGAFMYTSVQAQMNVPQAQFKLNPLGIRQAVEKEAQRIWRTSPWDGVGLKYFNSGNYGHVGNQPPNNIVDNELAESGLIGLGGFVLLAGCAVGAGYVRRNDPYVMAGLALVVGHLAHGQVDIYWQAGLVPLPYLVLGAGLARAPAGGRPHSPAEDA